MHPRDPNSHVFEFALATRSFSATQVQVEHRGQWCRDASGGRIRVGSVTQRKPGAKAGSVGRRSIL